MIEVNLIRKINLENSVFSPATLVKSFQVLTARFDVVFKLRTFFLVRKNYLLRSSDALIFC